MGQAAAGRSTRVGRRGSDRNHALHNTLQFNGSLVSGWQLCPSLAKGKSGLLARLRKSAANRKAGNRTTCSPGGRFTDFFLVTTPKETFNQEKTLPCATSAELRVSALSFE